MEHSSAGPNSPTPNALALDRQRRLIAVLGEINGLLGQSKTDIARALFTALLNATHTESGRLFLVDESGRPDSCLIAVNNEIREHDAATCPPLHELALAGWVFRQRRAVMVDDIGRDPHWTAWGESSASITVGSALSVPILTETHALGALSLIAKQPGKFSQSDLDIIAGLAEHAAIIIENAELATRLNLQQEANRRLRELAFLHETGQAIASTLDLDRILQLLLEKVRALLHIDAASIALRDDKTGNLVFEAASGKGAADVIGVQLEPGQGIAGWVAETGNPLVIQDAYQDARFFSEVDKKTGTRTQAILCIPIVLKGQVVGVIQALNPDEGQFAEQDIEILNALSGMAATAIDNAQLFTRVRSAESRYEGLFEDSANPIIITDLHGAIVEANRNACSLFGHAKERLQGANIAHLHATKGSLDFAETLERVRTGHEVAFQTRIREKDHRKTIEITGKQIVVKDTTVIQWIGRDISAEIELEQMREDMIRMIVHDLRNPLANIMNSLDVLHDVIMEGDETVSQDELLRIARRSGKRMHQLISSILDMSRLETGQVVLETQSTNLETLVLEAIEFIRPQIEIRNIHLSMNIPSKLPPVDIDSDMISRVILNVLDNACKFAPIGGKIHLKVAIVEAMIEVSITDDGPGIPADQLETIFEKFTRIALPDMPQGTGLGLAFCRLAIDSHGGRIWAESTLGHGSSFHLTLPISYSPLYKINNP